MESDGDPAKAIPPLRNHWPEKGKDRVARWDGGTIEFKPEANFWLQERPRN